MQDKSPGDAQRPSVADDSTTNPTKDDAARGGSSTRRVDEVVIPIVAEDVSVETARVARGAVRVRKHVETSEQIEEDLSVGKEAVERGRMRIYNVVTEREVQQNVALRDETIRVQRCPVSRSIDINEDLFKARSFEMVEMDEIAKVKKAARVVEEDARQGRGRQDSDD
jgi:hypothetical protein